MNLSKSGASLSLGGRGLHYNIGPKGTRTTVSLPGTGLSLTQYSPHSSPRSETAPSIPGFESHSPRTPVQLGDPPLVPIESASTETINALSTSELAPILHSVHRRVRYFPIVLSLSVIQCVIALWSADQALLVLAALYATVFVPASAVLDRYRRSVRIEYKTQGIADKITAALAESFGDMQASQSVWAIQAHSHTTDWKRHAGATGLIKRKRIELGVERPACLRGRVSFPTINLGSERLFFLPDAALLMTASSVAAVPYQDLNVASHLTRFVEEERVPSDASVVDHTWRFVNKNGARDRRFNFNKQLPVCLYAETDLQSGSGLNYKIHFSKATAPERFSTVAAALRAAGPSHSPLRSFMSYEKPRRWPSIIACGFFALFGTGLALKSLLIPSSSVRPWQSQDTVAPDVAAPKSVSSAGQTERRTSVPQANPSTLGTASAPADVGQSGSLYAIPGSHNSVRSLRSPADIAWVQSRLRDYGFATRDPVGVWGPASVDALLAFRTINGLGVSEPWDEATERRLASSDAIRADRSFLGGWASTEQCKDASGAVPLVITIHGAEVEAGVCNFLDIKRDKVGWRIRATCSVEGKTWLANIAMIATDNALTWSSEKGTATYLRCR